VAEDPKRRYLQPGPRAAKMGDGPLVGPVEDKLAEYDVVVQASRLRLFRQAECLHHNEVQRVSRTIMALPG
jgi:hypothetical protein